MNYYFPPAIECFLNPQGPQGCPGRYGLNGFIGPRGPQGVQGFQGSQGPQGPQGEYSDCNEEYFIINQNTTISNWMMDYNYFVDTSNSEIIVTLNPPYNSPSIISFRLMFKRGMDAIIQCQNPNSTFRLDQYDSEKTLLYHNNKWMIIGDYEINSFYPTNQQNKLVGFGTGPSGDYAYQGKSVSLSDDGNTLAVGCSGYIDGHDQVGSVIIFQRNNEIWNQQGDRLIGTGVLSQFPQQGASVSLSSDGNTLAFGGPFDNYGIGATWIFTRNGTTWTQQTKLIGTGNTGTSQQGISVALNSDGNTLAVGGPYDNGGTGATWIFTRSGTTWTQQGNKLIGNGFTGSFIYQGFSVSLDAEGNTLAVGGFGDAGNGIGGTGATWIFTRINSVWEQQGSKLIGSGFTGTYVNQGFSVSLDAFGDTLAVGGPEDNNGTGATWIFVQNNGIWNQQGNKLVGYGNTGSSPNQAYSVSLSSDGNTLAVGGPNDNSGTGATWIFIRNNTVWSQNDVKLVGSNSLGSPEQGYSVSLSSDGNTLAVGGPIDKTTTSGYSIGGTWVFV